MAKVSAAFDTKTKEFTFSFGAANIPMDMLQCVYFERGYDYKDGVEVPVWRCRVNMYGKDKEEGVSVFTTVVASQKESMEGIEVISGPPESHSRLANMYKEKKCK